jgi:hypothetical protein
MGERWKGLSGPEDLPGVDDLLGSFHWYDALCINQQDLQERAHQIGRMRTIYGDAWAVIAWLGEEENNSSKAFDLLQSLSFARSKDGGEELEIRLYENPDYLGSGGWMALHDLMRRTYWSRLWIIQEVVLGSVALVLRCGDSFINWTSFCHGIGVLFEHLWTVKDTLLVREVSMRHLEGQRRSTWGTTSLHLVYRDLWALSQFEGQGGGDRMSFGRLLDVANAAHSQDKRDRVYGLVGMMDPVIAQNIIPNYQFPESKAYAAIAKTFICVYGNLEPVREGNPWGQSNSPSWAADWTWDGRNRHARLTAGIYGPFWRQKGHPPVFRPAMPYCASGGKLMEASFSNDDLYLTCRGFLVDEVDGLSARELGFFSWAEHSIDQPISTNNAYGNSDAVVKALYRALVGDRVAGGLRATERHATILSLPSTFVTAGRQFERLKWTWLSKQRNYYFRWSRWRLANRHFRVMGKPLGSYFSETIPDNASEYDYTGVYNCADRMIKGRRFMTTANGHLGWVPDNMYGNDENQVQKGDEVAVLFGSGFYGWRGA